MPEPAQTALCALLLSDVMVCHPGGRGCLGDQYLLHLLVDFVFLFPPTYLHRSVPFPLHFWACFLSSVTAFLSCVSYRTLFNLPGGSFSTPTFTGLTIASTGCLGSRRKETLASDRHGILRSTGMGVDVFMNYSH